MLGTNDAKLDYWKGGDNYKKEYKALLEDIGETCSLVLVGLSPPSECGSPDCRLCDECTARACTSCANAGGGDGSACATAASTSTEGDFASSSFPTAATRTTGPCRRRRRALHRHYDEQAQGRLEGGDGPARTGG